MSAKKQLVLVVGVGRSGTSLLTGVLGQLGFHVPQPEVTPDDTNPRGFSEPRWAVDFHTKLLKKQRVTVNDSRPAAWDKTGATAQDPQAREELREWLAGQMREANSIVVKDPRTGWFLPLWTSVSAELDVEARYVTMLRHPAEILVSATKSYGTWQSPASRASAWINITLETEKATRGSRRAFVRYEDLMADWPREIGRVAELLELESLRAGDLRARFPAVDQFVDPTLHRNRVPWDELEVPARVRDMAEQVWQQLQPLAGPGGDTPELHAELDRARAAYGELYAESEAVAQSSIAAAKPRKQKKPATPSTPRARIARRVPAPLRKRIGKAVRSLRRS